MDFNDFLKATGEEMPGGVDQFAWSIHQLIEYHRLESDISYSEMVGALELAKAELTAEALNLAEASDEDDEELNFDD
jgi:hypothetical protein